MKIYDANNTFIFKPMLARAPRTAQEFPFDKENYWAELKYDGVRALLVGPNSDQDKWGKLKAYHRSNTIIGTNQFKPFDMMPRTIIDGELIESIVYAFDLPLLLGEDLTNFPLKERRNLLETVVSGLNKPNVKLSLILPSSREAAERVVAEGHEGVVLKEVNSPYRPGERSYDWIKAKSGVEIDAIIMGLTPSTVPGHSNLRFGLFIDGVLTETGTVKYSNSVEVNAQLIGKVAVIRGQKIFESGHVRHPRIVRFRDDKTPKECTGDQLTRADFVL